LQLQRRRHQLAAGLPHQLQALLLLLGQPWVRRLAQLQALLVLQQLLLHLLLAGAWLCHQLEPLGWESVLSRMRLHQALHKVIKNAL
jgi:hypothetical protein